MSQDQAAYTTKREVEQRIIQQVQLKKLAILVVLREEKRRKEERERQAQNEAV